ncbi:MAG: glycoside hydrolase [Marinilabiliales bacterium]|nr:glycoside hydrolase [Marinilabiliales bacterium]
MKQMKWIAYNKWLFSLWLLFSACASGAMTSQESGNTPISGKLIPAKVPAFVGKKENLLYWLDLTVNQGTNAQLKRMIFRFTRESRISGIERLAVVFPDGSTVEAKKEGADFVVEGLQSLQSATTRIGWNFTLAPNISLTDTFQADEVILLFNDGTENVIRPATSFVNRPALLLRGMGQDQVNTYRIPGLVTTRKGTLIAVFDLRYRNSGDLQGDIDVGMCRSTDQGATWEPTQKIIDMGTFGNLPEEQNGVGDPSILVDSRTNTLWVAGLWAHGFPGRSAWGASGAGLTPQETGQLVLVKSEDDGLTWSQPINITAQCKRPEWHLFFQGPGRGITMRDGTLVFPAQFRDGEGVPWSTLVYSKDHGKSWRVATGAKPNTTEAQVVELSDGQLMLNMRDDRNRTDKGPTNGRAVAITQDLGEHWTVHPSSNGALPESNCMASLLAEKIPFRGVTRSLLFFSNPNDKQARAHMTLKVSSDEGLTWPEDCQAELNSVDSYGYSCLTLVNDSVLGILYEGTRELYFQKIVVKDLLNKMVFPNP